MKNHPKKPDKHDWNTFENYQHIYSQCVTTHPFLDQSKTLPEFVFHEIDGDLVVEYSGNIYCKNSIVLSVVKYYETRLLRDGRLQVRCFSYSYNGSIIGKFNILRYDNNDDFYDFHKHIFSLVNGHQIERIQLTREIFPVLSDVLDELQNLSEKLN
jgi:hypothetical protein